MSPLLIVGLVIAAVIVLVFLFGLTPDPNRRRSPRILKRRSRYLRFLPILPLLGAVGCLVLAFTGFRFSVQETSPVAILVMDVSRSMEATDVAPSRLAAAQTAARSFLDELPSDFQVGFVTFAGTDELAVAPTTDHEEVAVAVGGVETTGGTLLWDGLELSLDAIEQHRAGGTAPAAVLVLSDGRDTDSDADPSDVADRATSLAVPIYGVLLGQISGESGADLEALQDVSAPTGGEIFTAETADELDERFRAIGSRFSVDLAADPSTTPLVVAAIALVVIAGIMLVWVQR